MTGSVDGLSYEQTITLWQGMDRVNFALGCWKLGELDALLRVRFPVDLPGALPVSEVASAVVGRGYASTARRRSGCWATFGAAGGSRGGAAHLRLEACRC